MIWLCKIFGHKYSYHWICERCGHHAGTSHDREEIDEIMPPRLNDVSRDDVITLMILAWLRGAAWQSHDTN